MRLETMLSRQPSRQKRVIAIILSAIALVVFCAADPATSHADDGDGDGDETSSESSGENSSVTDAPKTKWGVGFRVRNVRVPKGLLELFVDRAAGSISTVGFGGEVTKRSGNMELILGFEYEQLIPNNGSPSDCVRNPAGCIWVDKGDQLPQDEPDLVKFDGFGWFTIDFTFAWRNQFNKMFALRYGAGIGLGFVLGDILRTDYRCTTAEVTSCSQSPTAQNLDTPEDDVPPVFPVINAMIGLQVTPVEQVSLNFEVGIRTFPYMGMSAAYFF